MVNKSDTSVFISRRISNDEFISSVKEIGVSLFDFSLLNFSVIPFVRAPKADWYFFYSKLGAYYFFEQLSQREKRGIRDKKIGCIGESTAIKAKEYIKRKIDFIGRGSNDEIAPQFSEFVGDQSVCFVQANDSKSMIQSYQKELNYTELVVYDNVIDSALNIPNTKYVALTSSKNAHAYFRHYSNNEDRVFISIGESTSNTISDYVKRDQIHTARVPEESVMLKLLSDLIRLEK